MNSTRWIKYVIVLFIIVAVYNGNRGSIRTYATKFSHGVKSFTTATNKQIDTAPKTPKSETQTPPIQVEPGNKDSVVSNFTANVINKVLDNPKGRVIFEEVVNKMVDNYHGTFGEDLIHKEFIAKDMKVGTGPAAECGDKVSISYTTLHTDKSQENLLVTKEIELGSGYLNKAMENGIIGMKENGNRKIIYVDSNTASNNKTNNKKDFITGDVTLNKIIKNHRKTSDWGIFIDKKSFSLIGPKVMCGDNIDAYYRIRKVSDGKVLYDSKKDKKKISLNTGSKKMPYKITEGLMGLVKNKSKVSILGNPKSLNYKDKNGTELIPRNIEQNKLLILEIDTKTQP